MTQPAKLEGTTIESADAGLLANGPDGLPQPLTPLIGRTAEIEAVLHYLSQPDIRLVTLTGTGGVGKTRLALKVAHLISEVDPDRVVFVSLATVQDATLVRAAIAQAYGVPVGEPTTLLRRLLASLCDRPRLLVLDNFEQVISEAVVVAELLSHCPHLQVLVTSRMPLHLQGEQEFVVPPLVSPDPAHEPTLESLARNEAVTLFVQRARAATPMFQLTERNARVVAEICARLDGLPLALELAAARIKIFPPESLLKRLEGRLEVLTGGPRDLPSRQRTMRDAIGWSYDLLGVDEQVVFRRLAVFSGSFSLPAAADSMDFPAVDRPIGAAPLDVVECLRSLMDKSLVLRVDGEGSEYRFRMLETIREFGTSQVIAAGEYDIARRRILDYCTNLVISFEYGLVGPNQSEMLQELDLELGNLRVALQTTLDLGGDAMLPGVRLASGLWRYWLVRGQIGEGSRWLGRILNAATDIPTDVQALALNNLGNLALELGQYTKSHACYTQSLAAWESIGDLSGVSDELNNLGLLELIQAKFDTAREMLERSLAVRRQIGDSLGLPNTLSNLGDIASFDGNHRLAEQYHLEALTIRREVGNKRGIGLSLSNLGNTALYQNDFPEAERWYREGLDLLSDVGDQYGRASLLLGLGKVCIRSNRYEEGLGYLEDSLKILRAMGARRVMADAVDAIAEASVKVGRFEHAARLIGCTSTMREGHQIGITHRSKEELTDLLAVLHAQLGEKGFTAACDSGKRMTLESAVDVSLTLAGELTKIARTSPPPATSNPAQELGLTPREIEVLSLLTQGLSDKEIADQLYISPRTAMTHVGNILSKLGVNKRSMATSVAVRRGLVEVRT